MPTTWYEGAAVSKPVEWTHIEQVVQVNPEKELLGVEINVWTKHTVYGDGYFDSIQLLKNLTNDKVMGSEKIFHLFDEVTGTWVRPVFGAIADSRIVACHIVPTDGITGDDSDYMQLRLVNYQTSEDICTKTFVSGINAVAHEVTDFGPVDTSAAVIPAGGSVSLEKQDYGSGMTLPQCIIIIEWDLT